MKSYFEQVSKNTSLQEGTQVIEQLLLECYLNPGISTKELARRTLLPTPVAAAIKRELIQAGALVQDRGVRCASGGTTWIERERGYKGLNRLLHRDLLHDTAWPDEIKDVLTILKELFPMRPSVDVRIDQSKCTPETSLRRAILCLRQHALIGKRILCVGDDDLVSVSIGLLLKRLFPDGGHIATRLDVLDIDMRFIQFIENAAREWALPVQCHPIDLREPLPEKLQGQYDCFFTDPPYTLQGISLFVSRGIQALKREKGLPIFLSFAHKSPDFMLAMQREFNRMGLIVSANYPRFNAYEGAEMLANQSQIFILRTTEQTIPVFQGYFTDALYTGELKQTLRTYRCKQCSKEMQVGIQGELATIEQLKSRGCDHCGNDTFDMVARY